MNVVNAIKVRGARVHNLKNINVDVPLNQIVGIAGISGTPRRAWVRCITVQSTARSQKNC